MHQHTVLTLVAFYVCVRLKHASARQTRHRVHATWRCIHPGTSAAFLARKAIVGFMNSFPLVSMQRMQRYNVFVGPCLYLCSFLSLFFYAFNICSHAYFAAHRLLSWMPGAGGGSASCGWIGSLSFTDGTRHAACTPSFFMPATPKYLRISQFGKGSSTHVCVCASGWLSV